MMHTWFECKIRYEKVMENGMNKKVTEPYLVDALSFTEAEARIIEEITPYISGEFTVSTSNEPTTANCSPLKKMQPTAGLSASCSSSRWTKKRSRKKDLHYRTGTSFRPARRCKETGRRNERYNGRLRDCIRSRNRHHGCLPIRSRTGCET